VVTDEVDQLAQRLDAWFGAMPPELVRRIVRLRMRQLLRKTGMSDRTIALALGVHPKTLWRDERELRMFLAGEGRVPRGYPRARGEEQ
jgi:hypothetical protein